MLLGPQWMQYLVSLKMLELRIVTNLVIHPVIYSFDELEVKMFVGFSGVFHTRLCSVMRTRLLVFQYCLWSEFEFLEYSLMAKSH